MILKSRIRYLLPAVSLLVSCYSLSCFNIDTNSPQKNTSGEYPSPNAASKINPTRLTDINLATIGALAPKGRVQDTEYNRLPLVEQLIAHGKDSIPFLISKLNDETKITEHVVDYWEEVRVGDVALIILINFFINPTWTDTTIPGVGWDKFLERGANTDITGEQVLRNYISRHGRNKIKARWQKIWETHRDKLEWDEKERCFKLAQ